ncbi:MAG: toxin-antitoxin system HicB family antitoxin [Janthinobacterium lividum]
MPSESRKASIDRFPLRLMPSVRKNAEVFSDKEGVSLNQFINVAVAEKLAHLEHDEWIQKRKKPSTALSERALEVLNRANSPDPEPGDEWPSGYTPVAPKTASRKRQA